MCVFNWSEEVQKQLKKQDIELVALLFLVGLLLFFYPVVTQVSSYHADEEEYEDLAMQFMPETSPEPILVIPKKTNTPTEELPHFELPFMIAEPTDTDMVESSPKDAEELLSVSPIPSAAALSGTLEDEPKDSAHPTVAVTSAPTGAVAATPTIKPSVPTTAPTQSISGIDLSACLAQNKDFVAWLSIPDTKINYPVVRSDNTEYYLHHLFTGKESKLGCLFSLKSSNYQTPSKNIAIYGHHISHSDAMFSTLVDYKDASYCAAHSLIHLNSLYRESSYRIFAVLNIKVSDWDAAVASFPSDESFLRFVNRAVKNSMVDTGVQVTAEDNILTLITCDRSYGGASGRLIVMAVEQ